MRLSWRGTAALLMLVACGGGDEPLASLPVAPPATCAGTPTIHVDTVASHLAVPWAIVRAPDGRVFFTERAGRIRVIRDGVLQPEPWASLPAAEVSSGEGGLMGIAFDPDSASGFVYVVATFPRPISLPMRVARRLMRWVDPTWKSAYVNRVVRFREEEGRGVEPTILVDDLPSSIWVHAGADLRFGPDGMLYVSLGDGGHPDLAQHPEGPNGAILRYRRDGSIPPDNPEPDSPVYAHGLRNVQGFDWDPSGGAMVAIDHGPTGLESEGYRFGHDELNAIVRGGNYGWPAVAGAGGDARYRDPLLVWHPVFAPARARFGPAAAPAGEGAPLYVTALRGPPLTRVLLQFPGEPGATASVACQQPLLGGPGAIRLRALEVMPDGSLLVGTSNRDGRGTPREGDDMILRIRLGDLEAGRPQVR